MEVITHQSPRPHWYELFQNTKNISERARTLVWRRALERTQRGHPTFRSSNHNVNFLGNLDPSNATVTGVVAEVPKKDALRLRGGMPLGVGVYQGKEENRRETLTSRAWARGRNTKSLGSEWPQTFCSSELVLFCEKDVHERTTGRAWMFAGCSQKMLRTVEGPMLNRFDGESLKKIRCFDEEIWSVVGKFVCFPRK